MAVYSELKEKLTSYLERTAEISKLSTPSVQYISNADEYQKVLRGNNRKIALMREENNALIQDCFLPILDSSEPLSEDEIQILREFADALQDETAMELVDVSLLWRISERMMDDAGKKDDPDYLVEQIDFHIVSCMGKMTQLKCLPGEGELWQYYHAKGRQTVDLLFHMLEKEQFSRIQSEYHRRMLLVNSRYFCVIYDVPGLDEETRDWLIDRMIQAYALAEDPFYRELVPNYDWFKHCLKNSEYIGQLTERNNEAGYSEEQCKRILPYAMRLQEYYEQNPELVNQFVTKFDIDVILLRAKYYAGEMSRKEFCKKLLEFYQTRNGKSKESYALFADFQMPNDYIGNLDRDKLTEEEMANINTIYQNVISDLYKLPNKDAMSIVIEYVARMMEHYIEIPGGMTFREFYLKMLTAVWPQAYIHAQSTAQIARCICGHLCEARPEIFLGMFHCNTKKEVWKHKDEICAFAYHAALLHDIGNISMLQMAGIAVRGVFEEDKKIIALHPLMGARLAEGAISTKPYAHVILEHDGIYCDEKAMDEQRPIVDIIYMADHLDEYVQDMEIHELPFGSAELLAYLQDGNNANGAPYLMQLCRKTEVKNDLDFLLTTGREAIYRHIYIILKEVQDRGKL